MEKIEVNLTIKNIKDWGIDWENKQESELLKLKQEIKDALFNSVGIDYKDIELNLSIKKR